MTIVSARDFRANQGKYFSMVNSAELRGALRELKEVIAGKKQLNTLDSLIDEL